MTLDISDIKAEKTLRVNFCVDRTKEFFNGFDFIEIQTEYDMIKLCSRDFLGYLHQMITEKNRKL